MKLSLRRTLVIMTLLMGFQLFAQSSEAGESLYCISNNNKGDYALIRNGNYVTTMSYSACNTVIDLTRRKNVSYSNCFCNYEDLICGEGQYETTFKGRDACNEARDVLLKIGRR